jgi:hypothetical protein
MPSMLRALMRSTSAPGKLFSIPNRTPIFFMGLTPFNRWNASRRQTESRQNKPRPAAILHGYSVRQLDVVSAR